MSLQQIRNQQDVDQGLANLLEIAPQLNPLAKVTGQLPLRLQDSGFAGLARIIIGQQVSRASADAIHARFCAEIVPQSPQAYVSAGEAAWIRIGLSRAKQATLDGLANAIAAGELDLERIPHLPADAAIAELTKLKGIGTWTAEVYLLFCAGHPDLFPAGDLALREAVFHGLQLQDKPDEKKTREIAFDWSPHRGVAARLFWAYYALLKNGKPDLPV